MANTNLPLLVLFMTFPRVQYSARFFFYYLNSDPGSVYSITLSLTFFPANKSSMEFKILTIRNASGFLELQNDEISMPGVKIRFPGRPAIKLQIMMLKRTVFNVSELQANRLARLLVVLIHVHNYLSFKNVNTLVLSSAVLARFI